MLVIKPTIGVAEVGAVHQTILFVLPDHCHPVSNLETLGLCPNDR